MRTWMKIVLLGLVTVAAAAPSVLLLMHRTSGEAGAKAPRQPLAAAGGETVIARQTAIEVPVVPVRAAAMEVPAALIPAAPVLAATFNALPPEPIADVAAEPEDVPVMHTVARVDPLRADPADVEAPAPVAPQALAATRRTVEAEAGTLERAALEDLVRTEARNRDLPEDLAIALVSLASGWDPQKKGDNGRLGLTQVTLSIARAYRYKGDVASLMRPEINVQYGLAYVAGAWRKAGRDLCRTAMKIAGGHSVSRMTPAYETYCERLKTAMAERAAPVRPAEAEPAPVADKD